MVVRSREPAPTLCSIFWCTCYRWPLNIDDHPLGFLGAISGNLPCLYGCSWIRPQRRVLVPHEPSRPQGAQHWVSIHDIIWECRRYSGTVCLPPQVRAVLSHGIRDLHGGIGNGPGCNHAVHPFGLPEKLQIERSWVGEANATCSLRELDVARPVLVRVTANLIYMQAANGRHFPFGSRRGEWVNGRLCSL